MLKRTPKSATRRRSACQTVLIIGGNARARNRHAIELETHGYFVECADSSAVAVQTHAQTRPGLVLFCIEEADADKTWDVFRAISRRYPAQLIGYALNSSQHLCSVSCDGAEVMKEQGPDDLIATVEALIGPAEGEEGRVPSPVSRSCLSPVEML